MIKQFLKAFIYALIPKVCIYCERALSYDTKQPLCNKCISQIKFINGLVCQKCGLPLDTGGAHCYNCKKSQRKFYINFVRSVVYYLEPIVTLIHEFKYRERTYLKSFLGGELLVNWWQKNFNLFPNIDIVCCVPIHPIKHFLRGYNQAELLAVEFSNRLNLNFEPKLIKRKKFTSSQFKLSREERLQNVNNAFSINKKLIHKTVGKNILIIDDVCTTAETINQCAKPLKEAGAKNVFGLVLARDV
ncbi:MAG: ComF family protein [Endomicrobia bacterium]|nr:ComF family protein [Endomicrobiia bacterium]MDW8055365.1 ComF family protein [Elusimicrobiota bacterium]